MQYSPTYSGTLLFLAFPLLTSHQSCSVLSISALFLARFHLTEHKRHESSVFCLSFSAITQCLALGQCLAQSGCSINAYYINKCGNCLGFVAIDYMAFPLSPAVDGLWKHGTHSYKMVYVAFISAFPGPRKQTNKQKTTTNVF